VSIALVTGSGGLIGSEAVRFFTTQGLEVVGIENNMRKYFFGDEASIVWNHQLLLASTRGYKHEPIDIRNQDAIIQLFRKFGGNIKLIVHAAAQPSHDWAAREPLTDFEINSLGTLHLLEAARLHAPDAAFVFTSTNKVYGDRPNFLPLVELETRWEIDSGHPFAEHGIDESMSIDQTLHSLFGASKAAADLLVQEYGRYFGMKTVCLRGGCLTGPAHSGAQLHGFLAYLMKCAIEGRPYTVFGYNGKQVRDNIHSQDFVSAIWQYFKAPRIGEVYNIGGGRFANVSVIEAIRACEKLTGRPMNWSYVEQARRGDHIWWISDIRKFATHYPGWQCQYNLDRTLGEIFEGVSKKKAV
jgi:CDP-paratose 2-epimerase